MNMVNPFYIMGVEDVCKIASEGSLFSSHLSKIDPASVGYI